MAETLKDVVDGVLVNSGLCAGPNFWLRNEPLNKLALQGARYFLREEFDIPSINLDDGKIKFIRGNKEYVVTITWRG